eukprot:11948888-Karenia_brevis.AAC.1
MPHVRKVIWECEDQFRRLLSPEEIKALSLTEAPLFVVLRILPQLQQAAEQTSTTGSESSGTVSYTHLRAHETLSDL